MAPLKLESPLQYIKGVGPRKAAVLSDHGLETVRDLLFYLPRMYLDRTNVTPINSLQVNKVATVIGKVKAHGLLYGRRRRYEVILEDDTAALTLTFFQGIKYWQRLFQKGQVFAATGKLTFFDSLQLIHPELERLDDESDRMVHAGRIIPVYPQTAELNKVGLNSRGMRRLTTVVFDELSEQLPDAIPIRVIDKHGLPPLQSAVVWAHYPPDRDAVEKARRRLALDELLALQFLVYQNRARRDAVTKDHSYEQAGQTVEKFISNLAFELTRGQRRSFEEIMSDLRGKRPASRLLQGDVGCGKTVVAVAAGVYAAENRLQSAFMVPTEILAEQHFRTWRDALADIGVTCDLLTSTLTAAEKEERAKRAAEGTTDLLFGTHALIYDYVQFKRLGLVIIDEQHRFGVRQRARLHAKGQDPDLLVMTATPIPRTLALTVYGDLDISTIDTMPPGRKPVRTVWRTSEARDKVMQWVAEQCREGGQAYVVYPVIEPSEALQLRGVEDAYEELTASAFRDLKVGMVHGRLKPTIRDKTLSGFRSGTIDVLMATTVIEVGIDNPDATLMVIEHAERFGLAQLHQLRGRIGRGDQPATVVALTGDDPGDVARQRLEYLTASTDGFAVAEADLELRGPGEMFGVRQSGMPEIRIANLSTDRDLLSYAREIVADLFARRKHLDIEENTLYSFLKTSTERNSEIAGG
jgi:ATP-dependent DNA helicase RecG